jgi:hypothetical protein
MSDLRFVTTNLDVKIDNYLEKIIDNKTIKENYLKIRKELKINIKNFKLDEFIIEKLFMIFDKLYFKNLIQDKLHNNNFDINFGISNKFKNIAGQCKYFDNKIEIIFSSFMIDKIYNDKFKSIEINGLLCYDIIDVLIKLMEHEITHLILFIYDNYKNNIKSGHNDQFKKLVYNMYRHTKITHDLLTGDIDKYNKHKDNANKKLKIGMKIKCNNNIGTVINIKPKYILYKIDSTIKGCKFNEYKIINYDFEPYQKYLTKLKKKLKIGTVVKWSKYYGPIINIMENRIYFKDDKTSNIIWALIDIIQLK